MESNINLPIEGNIERNLGMEEFATFATSRLTALAALGVRSATLDAGDKAIIDPVAKVARYVTPGAEMLMTPNFVQFRFINPHAATEEVAQAIRQTDPRRTQGIAGTFIGMDQPRFSKLEAKQKASKKN